MARRPATPTTRLAQALQTRRAGLTLREAATPVGIGADALGRLERGGGVYQRATREAVARWLAWSEAEVIAASKTELPQEPRKPLT